MAKIEYLIAPKGTKFKGSGKLGLNLINLMCSSWLALLFRFIGPLLTRLLTNWLTSIIHPIHIFKSSDWLKGHMTWIIFNNVHGWKLIHVLYFLLFPCLSKKLSQLPNLELDSLLSRFYGSVRTKTSMNGVYKTNIDCSFILGKVENCCTLGKIQPWSTKLRALVKSRPNLNFTSGTIIFHHSPHEQSIFV